MAPAFANLFMGEFERKALEGYVDKPFLWLRYIDDILMVWTHGNEKLESFIAYLNSIHPTIKFTSERSTTSIPFLDVKILLENGKIETDLYCKPTDKHQYLLHSSSHPYHTKKSIPYSLALRLRRICSKRRSPNLRDLLVRAKLQNPGTTTRPNHSFGTFRCNSKHGCLTCPHIDNERTNYMLPALNSEPSFIVLVNNSTDHKHF